MAAKYKRPSSSGFFDTLDSSSANSDALAPTETAIVYYGSSLGANDVNIASGLLRYCSKYKVLSVIDSEKAEQDAGEVLNGRRNGIAVYRDLGTALAQAGKRPAYLIFGVTPAEGVLSEVERRVLLRAIAYGINITSGLHESLRNDSELSAACEKHGVVIRGL